LPAIKDRAMRFFAFDLSLLNLRDTVLRFGPTQTTKKISLLQSKIYFGTFTIFALYINTNFSTGIEDRGMRFFAFDLSFLNLRDTVFTFDPTQTTKKISLL
jgi:uncharacterized membrane protein YoaT (DUF817 family)